MSTVRNDQHYVRQPSIVFLRSAHVLAASAVLGLSAYCLDYITKYGYLISPVPSEVQDLKTAFRFAVFAFAYSAITFVYLEVSARWWVGAWNCWAALALYLGGVIFWLASFALLTSWAVDKEATWNIDHESLLYGISGSRPYTTYESPGLDLGASFDLSSTDWGLSYDNWSSIWKRDTAADYMNHWAIRTPITWKCGAAAAGAAALAWVLMVVILIVYSVSLHTHRLHSDNQNHPPGGSPMVLVASTQQQQEVEEVRQVPPQMA